MDDDDIVRRALRRMITSLSYVAVEFPSGDAFLAALSGETFACALIDLHMPALNGADVVAHMRRDGCKIPTIIVTGGDEPKTRERCLKAGADAYMVKPVERDAINDVIRSLIS